MPSSTRRDTDQIGPHVCVSFDDDYGWIVETPNETTGEMEMDLGETWIKQGRTSAIEDGK